MYTHTIYTHKYIYKIYMYMYMYINIYKYEHMYTHEEKINPVSIILVPRSPFIATDAKRTQTAFYTQLLNCFLLMLNTTLTRISFMVI